MKVIQRDFRAKPIDSPIEAIKIKPPLKWAGGKRWLLPHLRLIWQEHKHRRLVEPFCGGLAIAIGLVPDRALLNDINIHAINFYRWLQKGMVISQKTYNEEAFYYRSRELFNNLIVSGKEKSQEAAALFYYLNRTGYNGLCRFNRQGHFNVPFGRYKTINYVDNFLSYKRIIEGWQFVSQDFETIKLETNDFIYADPPYDVQFTQYAKEDFRWQDQVRLAQWLMRYPGPVVLSNQATPRIVALYQELGFQLQFLDAPRMISCTGNRTKAREVLAVKGI